MHSFPDLAGRCTSFTLAALNEADERTIEVLEASGATKLIVALQMIQLQKAIFAIGMFSIFEANLQDRLGCDAGFDEAKRILDRAGETALRESFEQVRLAINVLKHGRGPSYQKLVDMEAPLPFRVMPPDERFFEEGDVFEISTLVEVDDAFVWLCGDVISEVAAAIGTQTGVHI